MPTLKDIVHSYWEFTKDGAHATWVEFKKYFMGYDRLREMEKSGHAGPMRNDYHEDVNCRPRKRQRRELSLCNAL